MNVREINEIGHSIKAFVLIFLIMLLLAVMSWCIWRSVQNLQLVLNLRPEWRLKNALYDKKRYLGSQVLYELRWALASLRFSRRISSWERTAILTGLCNIHTEKPQDDRHAGSFSTPSLRARVKEILNN